MVDAPKFSAAVAERRRLLAMVHVAIKDLGLTDADYRSMLAMQFQVSSAKDLKNPQLRTLVARFESLGWRNTKPGKGSAQDGAFIRIDDADPRAAQKRHFLSCWVRLGYAPKTLNTRIKRQWGVEDIRWLHDEAALQTLGRDLYARLRKKGLDPRDF